MYRSSDYAVKVPEGSCPSFFITCAGVTTSISKKPRLQLANGQLSWAGGLGNLAVQYAKKVFNSCCRCWYQQWQTSLPKKLVLISPSTAMKLKMPLPSSKKTGGAHSAVVTAVSKVAFNRCWFCSCWRSGSCCWIAIWNDGPQHCQNCSRWYPSHRFPRWYCRTWRSLPVWRWRISGSYRVSKASCFRCCGCLDEMEAGTIQGRMVLGSH